MMNGMHAANIKLSLRFLANYLDDMAIPSMCRHGAPILQAFDSQGLEVKAAHTSCADSQRNVRQGGREAPTAESYQILNKIVK